MAITEKDIKKLWGLAAGRCSKPGCQEECIRFLDGDHTVIGEMAHVIAKKPKGPRGKQGGGADTYENLILLCPTHHREVDKAPSGVFPASTLMRWKGEHESAVRNAFQSPVFATRDALGIAIKQLLVQNKSVWENFGPESLEAQRNPLSNLHALWELRKLGTIVPNNRRIVSMLEANRGLVDLRDNDICAQFIEHAEGFERNCYKRTEGIPRFPGQFERLVNRYALLE